MPTAVHYTTWSRIGMHLLTFEVNKSGNRNIMLKCDIMHVQHQSVPSWYVQRGQTPCSLRNFYALTRNIRKQPLCLPSPHSPTPIQTLQNWPTLVFQTFGSKNHKYVFIHLSVTYHSYAICLQCVKVNTIYLLFQIIKR